jgi:hypothetical protein
VTNILQEVRRNLTHIPPDYVDARLNTMDREFLGARVPEVRVATSMALVPAGVDAGDRHVVAAALAENANTIVTANTRHFAADELRDQLGISVLAPDPFLVTQFGINPLIASAAIAKQVARLRRPARSVREHIELMRPSLPEFAAVLDEYLPQIEAAL